MTERDETERLARAWAVWPSGIEALPETEREWIADRLRPESVRETIEAALGAPPGGAGERDRRRLRLVIPPYLAQAAAEFRKAPDRGYAISFEERAQWLADASWEADPAVRERAVSRLVEDAERRREFEAEQRARFDRAAVRAGAADARSLFDGSAPSSPGIFLERAERAAIAPLDAAVARGALLRRRRSPWCLGDRAVAAEAPFLERLGDRAALLRASAVRAAVRQIERAVGRGGTGADLETRGGPGGLLLAFRGLGRSLHRAISGRLGVEPGSDPAFGFAWEALFARVAARGKGLERLVPPLDEDVRRDVAFESALTPRRMWARGFGSLAWETDQVRREERASGRPGSAAFRIPSLRPPVERSAPLRGTLLAVHLEERLLGQFGYAFWESKRARAFLEEIGEAERGETVDSVAAALGAGTMDPSPIVDVYRP